ncbi:SurA N-terminal domain-containing protein [Sphingomonas sp. TX0543]|uniref:peptidylprolyl isomerase n=1 Tax=unclassified Sphingomonas TaxID=196159 RepID=UPI0010F5A53E|nr:peptidylprolyl isomerase [Sphingomonas sp. 3P27F8]
MLGFFRRLINSKVGLVITFVILGMIALAFAAGDVTGLRSGSGGMTKTTVARIGNTAIGEAQLKQRVTDQLNEIRQQNPAIDMPTLIADGGVESILDQLISGIALEKFGQDQGMSVSRALVGSELQSIPALIGPTGKFDQAIYERILQQRRMTDKQVQAEIAQQAMARFLLGATVGAAQVADSVALPYASLLLERRTGEAAFIPAAATAAGPAPTDAELADFYKRNVARYTVPERRVIRYARVNPEMVKAQAQPTEAEIAQAYNADRAKYAAKEKRSLTQVVVLDRKAADALVAKARSGSIADAARAAGLEPRTLSSVEKSAYATQTSAAAADAAFGAVKGAVVGPIKGGVGFVVVKVDAIEQVPAKTLAQVHDEIAKALTVQKTTAAMSSIHDKLDDASAENANFSELVADNKLTAETSPALAATGINPDDPASKADPALAEIVKAGFAAEEGDSPTLVQTAADGSFALVALDRIVHSAPRPLTQVREAVAKDFIADRARKAARQAAAAVLAKVQKGTPLAQAAAGVNGVAIRPLAGVRGQIAQQRGADPALALMFSLPGGAARMLEAANNTGWIVVKVATITAGDAGKVPPLVASTKRELGTLVGREYAMQFTNAVKAELKVQRNAADIARVKADLLGKDASNQ